MKCNNQHTGEEELCASCSSASPRPPYVNIDMNVGRLEDNARVVGVEQTVQGPARPLNANFEMKAGIIEKGGKLTGMEQTLQGPARQEFIFNLGGEAKKELWNGSSIYLKCNRTATVGRFHDDLRTHLKGDSLARVHVYVLPSSDQDCPEHFLKRLKETEFGTVMRGVAANPFAVNWSKEDAKSPDLALAGIQVRLLKGLNLPDNSDYHTDPATHFARELTNLAEHFDYIFISHTLSSDDLHPQAEKLIKDHLKQLCEIKFIKCRLLLFFFAEDSSKNLLSRLLNRKSCAERLAELIENCGHSNKITQCSLPPLEMIQRIHVQEMLMNAGEKAIHPDVRQRIEALYSKGTTKVRLKLIVDELE